MKTRFRSFLNKIGLKLMGTPDKLIVFLGNPGKNYERSRHNVGFMVADELADSLGIKINKLRFRSLSELCKLADKKFLLIKPQTYMNLSGTAVREAMSFYKLEPKDVLVISDDMDLPIGKIRIRKKGSAGGHNGLADIIQKIGSCDFARLRIGIGKPPHENYDSKDWVLGSFSESDKKLIDEAVRRAAAAVSDYAKKDLDEVMNEYNK